VYSRNTRTALIAAIVLPVVGIAAVLLYVDASSSPGRHVVEASSAGIGAEPSPVAETVTTDIANDVDSSAVLLPIGPRASTRVTVPASGTCAGGSCTTTTQRGCSSDPDCGD